MQFKYRKLIQHFCENKSCKLYLILILTIFCIGGLILFFPIQNIIIFLLSLIILLFFTFKPIYSFYLMILTAPIFVNAAVGSQGLPFNHIDVLILFAFVFPFVKYVISYKKPALNTKIDKWFIILFFIFMFFGFISINHRGYQGFLNYIELVIIYYLTIYFIRTGETSELKLINILSCSALIQAGIGILQSLTGSFGANFQDERGFLGYLGLGASLVWHGNGTFDSFNALGSFLCSITLFLIPIHYYLNKENKNKMHTNIIFFVLIWGIITTYSRNALISLITITLLFLFKINKNKLKFLFILALTLIPITILALILKDTSYVLTINSRDKIWSDTLSAIFHNGYRVMFGTGLRSCMDAVELYLPGNIDNLKFVGQWRPHNFFLFNFVETGLVGTSIIVGFYLTNLVNFYKSISCKNNLSSILSFAGFLYISSIFTLGIFDMVFNYFQLQVFIFMILGLIYAKSLGLHKEN